MKSLGVSPTNANVPGRKATMDAKFGALKWRLSVAFVAWVLVTARAAAQTPAQAASATPATRVTLDQAIELALRHNHSLQAARTTILQNQALEITANLRPNPVALGDAQLLPLFHPSEFTGDYLDSSAQFDVGVSYLFERGVKRQHR